jgi:hypothetical protein
VDSLHVVRLAKRLDRDLPIAGQRHRDEGLARVPIWVEIRRVGRHRIEEVGERFRIEIEVDEHKVAEHFGAHLHEAVVVVANHTEAASRRNFAQLPLQAPAPSVIAASQFLGF